MIRVGHEDEREIRQHADEAEIRDRIVGQLLVDGGRQPHARPGSTVSVRPSGAARATAAADAVPPAPGRFRPRPAAPGVGSGPRRSGARPGRRWPLGVNPCIRVMVRPPWANRRGAIAHSGRSAEYGTAGQLSSSSLSLSGCTCLRQLTPTLNGVPFPRPAEARAYARFGARGTFFTRTRMHLGRYCRA